MNENVSTRKVVDENLKFIPASVPVGALDIIDCVHPRDGGIMTKAQARGDIYSQLDEHCASCGKCNVSLSRCGIA